MDWRTIFQKAKGMLHINTLDTQENPYSIPLNEFKAAIPAAVHSYFNNQMQRDFAWHSLAKLDYSDIETIDIEMIATKLILEDAQEHGSFYDSPMPNAPRIKDHINILVEQILKHRDTAVSKNELGKRATQFDESIATLRLTDLTTHDTLTPTPED